MKTYYFIFSKSDLLLQKQEDGTFTVPCADCPPIETKPWTPILSISPMADGTKVKAIGIDNPQQLTVTDRQLASNGHEFVGLRQTFYHLPMEFYLKAGKCQELLYWDQTTRFCGVCGSPMKMHTDISKRCVSCGKEVWPQLSTAIIVLIRRGEEVLLVRARNFKSEFFGLVAGFVETGETLEEAVRREVSEETGIEIDHISYFGSQPWPYPMGLMVGFTADYVSGELHLQQSEIAKAGWFRYDALPRIPEKLSIARRLIDAWLAEHGRVSEQV